MRLYAFLDESGPGSDTVLFVVAVVLVESTQVEALEKKLIRLEKTSGKTGRKWHGSTVRQQVQYLEGAVGLLKDVTQVYWRCCEEKTDYAVIKGETLAAAVTARTAEGNTKFTAVIDGMSVKERETIARVPRQIGVRWQKLATARDEASPCIRLVDALAGFLRDYLEKKAWAVAAWQDHESLFSRV